MDEAKEAYNYLPEGAGVPGIGETVGQGDDVLCRVKLFTPDGQWTWWIIESDGEDLCWGLVSGFEVELGYFSLSELREVRGQLGLPIERDLHWTPKPYREVVAQARSL